MTCISYKERNNEILFWKKNEHLNAAGRDESSDQFTTTKGRYLVWPVISVLAFKSPADEVSCGCSRPIIPLDVKIEKWTLEMDSTELKLFWNWFLPSLEYLLNRSYDGFQISDEMCLNFNIKPWGAVGCTQLNVETKPDIPHGDRLLELLENTTLCSLCQEGIQQQNIYRLETMQSPSSSLIHLDFLTRC